MNHLPLQCRIMRRTLSNLTFLPHQIKTAVPNWFRRRSFAVLNTSVRFGTWVEPRLNRALVCQAPPFFFSHRLFLLWMLTEIMYCNLNCCETNELKYIHLNTDHLFQTLLFNSLINLANFKNDFNAQVKFSFVHSFSHQCGLILNPERQCYTCC